MHIITWANIRCQAFMFKIFEAINKSPDSMQLHTNISFYILLYTVGPGLDAHC